MSDATTPTDARLDIAPFEMLTRDEQYRHLVRFHHKNWNITTRTAKAQMEAAHAVYHQSEGGMREEHGHTAVPAPAPEGQPDGPLTDKLLSASSRKSLKDLVDNDFLALKAEIQQFANDMLVLRRQQLRKEWAEKGADKTAFIDKAGALMRTYRDDCERLVLEARTAGVTLKTVALLDQ